MAAASMLQNLTAAVRTTQRTVIARALVRFAMTMVEKYGMVKLPLKMLVALSRWTSEFDTSGLLERVRELCESENAEDRELAQHAFHALIRAK